VDVADLTWYNYISFAKNPHNLLDPLTVFVSAMIRGEKPGFSVSKATKTRVLGR